MNHPRFKLQGHEQEIAERYLRGESTPKIARVFGASVTSVNRCLHKLRGYIEESIEAAESLVAYLKKWKSYASTQ